MSARLDVLRKRFDDDISEHELTIMRDDGLYRHLRCRRPETVMYGFDVVTWPGYLALVGDMGDFMFRRIDDMLTFFESDSGRINPHYWSEKLQAGASHPRDLYEEFSYELFTARVREWRDEVAVEVDDPSEILGLVDAIDDQIFRQSHHGTSEHEAIELLRDFSHTLEGRDLRIIDWWEWSMRDYNTHFIWCCHAIVWAIAQYRALTPTEQEASHGRSNDGA